MQVILEESRAENETTIDNLGDTSYIMDRADSQEQETDNVLRGVDSGNVSLNGGTEIRRVQEADTSLSKPMALTNL
jgi:hypothetical protein